MFIKPLVEYAHWPVNNCLAFSTTRRLGNLNQSVDSSDNFSLIKQPFGDFNLGLHVGDNETQVLTNRKRLLALLPAQSSIQWLNQVHGDQVIEIDKVSSSPLEADALITRQQHIALAIMTADCLPIFIASYNGQVIAAIHGGWRCLYGNIIEKTVEKLAIPTSELCAWLGPCISQKNFELSNEIEQQFCRLNPALSKAFVKGRQGHCYGSLTQIATIQCQQLGIQQIINQSSCTYEHEQLFYSYRRQAVTGRMASIICRT